MFNIKYINKIIKQGNTKKSTKTTIAFVLSSYYKICKKFKFCNVFQFICQGTKKLMSDSPGLVNFAVGLVDFIFHLPNGQVKILGSHSYINVLG